jgi:hypothetical protein
MKKILQFVWNSPTLTTWGSLSFRTLGLLLVLPLLLNKFSTSDIALWYLFSTIIGFQLLFDLGFGSTFYRIIAYAFGGSENLDDLRRVDSNQLNEPRWNKISQIVGTMYFIYNLLAIGYLAIMGIIGSYVLIRPINLSSDITNGWIAWIVVLTTTAISLRGNIYNNYLLGLNKVAMLRRWEALTSLGGIISNIVVLLFNWSLLFLVISNQAWILISVIRNRFLCRRVYENRFSKFSAEKRNLDKEILNNIWPRAWRSAVGLFMNFGLIQASGLIFAQIGKSAEVASYLLGLRIIDTIKTFSQAPFYSKLPLLAKLRSQGKSAEQIKAASFGMMLSHYSYILAFILVGLFIDQILILIKSNAEFVNPSMWALMGIGFFLERFGAMHLQLYSTTNHIVWHIANGVSGLIYLVTSLILLSVIGVYAFPVGVIAGYLLFYSWYSAKYSYKIIVKPFFEFERYVSLVPFLILVLYCLISVAYFYK